MSENTDQPTVERRYAQRSSKMEDCRVSRRATVVLRRGGGSISRRGSAMVRMIQKHYTLIEPPEKTPQQLARESWLFPAMSVPFNRWFCMPAAFAIQISCGSLFTWVVFDKPIDKFIYGSAADIASPITFYVAVALMAISAAVMGPWLERKGPKLASMLGGLLFFIGNVIVSIALHMQQMWIVYVGYTISAGYGIGLCFISPISILQKWFPDHRGLASGISVFGFGAGSLLSGVVESVLIEYVDLPLTFAILGMSYFMCFLVAGLILRAPPPGYSPPGKQKLVSKVHVLPTISEDPEEGPPSPQDEKKEWTLLEALGSTEFLLMYVTFYANLLMNLSTTPKWISLITDVFGKSETHANSMILIRSGFDLFGRIMFPLLSDYIGTKNTYLAMLSSQLIILAGFPFIVMSKVYWLFLVSMWIVSMCYGGGFGTLSVFLVEKFGAVNVGPCFGVMITAWSLAGVTGGICYYVIKPAVADHYTKSSADPLPYNVVFWIFLGITVVGWRALVAIKPTAKDKEFVAKFVTKERR